MQFMLYYKNENCSCVILRIMRVPVSNLEKIKDTIAKIYIFVSTYKIPSQNIHNKFYMRLVKKCE